MERTTEVGVDGLQFPHENEIQENGGREKAHRTDEVFPYQRVVLLLSSIAVVTAIVWSIAGVTYNSYMPQAIPLLIIAYTLGLRHALDADHIAAIDNVTRRLVQDGQKPAMVGTFFSLGHSTIVIIATLLIAAISAAVQDKFNLYNNYATNVGKAISLSFLYFISMLNGLSVYFIVQDIKRIQHHRLENSGNASIPFNIDAVNSGFFSRLVGKYFFKLIDKTYKMYLVGFLFGLGFDTATEVSLLAISALQAVRGSAVWLIVFLSLLFTCGMVLVDSVDGILMLGVYNWATIQPDEKLYYNLIITSTSFVFASFIATVEMLSLIQSHYDLSTDEPFWAFIDSASDDDNFFVIGMALLISFVIGWLASRVVYRYVLPRYLPVVVSATSSDSDAIVVVVDIPAAGPAAAAGAEEEEEGGDKKRSEREHKGGNEAKGQQTAPSCGDNDAVDMPTSSMVVIGG